jgi:hypothetical protein
MLIFPYFGMQRLIFWAFEKSSVSKVRAASIFITAYFTLKKDRSKDYSVELYLYVCAYILSSSMCVTIDGVWIGE